MTWNITNVNVSVDLTDVDTSNLGDGRFLVGTETITLDNNDFTFDPIEVGGGKIADTATNLEYRFCNITAGDIKSDGKLLTTDTRVVRR